LRRLSAALLLSSPPANIRRLAFLAPIALVILPSIAFAAPRTFAELASLAVDILDGAAGLLILAGIVIYFYGMSTNILKMKDEGGEKMRTYLVWGIIVIFIMVSIWGILRLLRTTLFGNDTYIPLGTSSTYQPASFDAPVFTP
jgi:FtsH-binding integral membrane protein